MQITEWQEGPFEMSCNVKLGNVSIYEIRIRKRAPTGMKLDITSRCRKDRAVSIIAFLAGDIQGSLSFSLKETAILLVNLGISAGDLENFFQAATDMGWEDDLILEASQAACEILPPTEPTYLVVKIWRGIVSEYVYLPMAEAQQAIADYCSIDVTDIVYRTGLPFGDVYSASDEMDYDAWAFPAHDSGEKIETLSRQLEYALRAKAELFEEYARVCAELRILRKACSGGD